MIDFTTVVAVDAQHVLEWQQTWPTWRQFRPEILTRPLLVICDGALTGWEQRLSFLDHPHVTTVTWHTEAATQREKMLAALVYAPANHVATPWYLKLDTDVTAERKAPWISDDWFRTDEMGRDPVFVTSPWSYTKPGSWIPELDRWAASVPPLALHPSLNLPSAAGPQRLRHSRIISWCFFGNTAWTRQVVAYAPQRLPVPSQDTFLWYCAARRGDFFRKVSMDRYGWRHRRIRIPISCVDQSMIKATENARIGDRVGAKPSDRRPIQQPTQRRSTVCQLINRRQVKQIPARSLQLEGAPASRDATGCEKTSPTRSRGVVLLLTGPGHAVRLVVALHSLRKHWSGDITLFTTHPTSHEIGRLCAADSRLGVEHRTWQLYQSRRNASYLTKSYLPPEVPYDDCLFLDADTLVVGPLDEIWNGLAESSLVLTQFAHWTTEHRNIRRRIHSWSTIVHPNWRADERDRMIDTAKQRRPAVNVGVFAFRRETPILKRWGELASIGQRQFICDEIAMQLMLPELDAEVLDCRFNCSPVFARNTRDVRIWHFHGDKHLRRAEGRAIWLPAFSKCLQEDVASVKEWGTTLDSSAFENIATTAVE